MEIDASIMELSVEVLKTLKTEVPNDPDVLLWGT